MKNLLKLGIVLFLLICFTGCCSGNGMLWWNKSDNYKGQGCEVKLMPSGGVILSNINENADYSEGNNEPKLGVNLGVNIVTPINPKITLETGLGYTGKGSKSSYSDDYDGEESYSQEDKLNLSYLEMPILARYRFNNTGFSVYGGVQPALLLGAKQKSEATGAPSQDLDVKDNFKSFDASAIFGVGYEFKNGIMINAGYDLGLLNIAEKSDFGNTTVKNRAFKFSLGYKFKI